jgi:hypothetical protein
MQMLHSWRLQLLLLLLRHFCVRPWPLLLLYIWLLLLMLLVRVLLLLDTILQVLLLLLGVPLIHFHQQLQCITRPAGHQCHCITWAQLC